MQHPEAPVKLLRNTNPSFPQLCPALAEAAWFFPIIPNFGGYGYFLALMACCGFMKKLFDLNRGDGRQRISKPGTPGG
jgi:hypothetical protein